MAPSEWLPVTVAPCFLPCFCVFLLFCHVSSCTSLNRRSGPMVVQLLRLCMCLFLFLELFKSASANPFSHGSFVYTREQLLALCSTGVLPVERPEIPAELRRRRRGCRAGKMRREKKRRYKPCIPSVIMGNVRSLPNKMDELTALTRLQREYRECSIM